MHRFYPQIKICGLTDPDDARACADAGADAIGLVFYPPSPRHVSWDQAATIVAHLPTRTTAVGVFVNPSAEALHGAVSHCGLGAVQLHGAETPALIRQFQKRCQAAVFKALFTTKSPGLADAVRYDVAGYLVECGKGALPGGNAMQWNWALAKPFGRQYPLVLAGGLNPQTVGSAIADCLPDAVDASSGLERTPGHKDLAKVAAFIETVKQTGSLYKACARPVRRLF